MTRGVKVNQNIFGVNTQYFKHYWWSCTSNEQLKGSILIREMSCKDYLKNIDGTQAKDGTSCW